MAKRKPLLTHVERQLRSDGALCVTFCNASVRRPFQSYDDLLAWGLEVGAVDDSDGRRLAAAAAASPGQATGVLRSARGLLARLERVLQTLAGGQSPGASDLRELNSRLRRAMAHRQLDPAGKQWTWGDAEDDDLDRPLWPVLLSAAELLTSEDRRRVHLCVGQDCGLFFIANGGGRGRKWCDRKCSNRHSSRVHYTRHLKPVRQKWAREKADRQRMRLAGYQSEWPLKSEA
ncbi:MAG: ABATE domain-containing protein [Acidobacteriota bacterium]